ncbi:MAG: hypothetical protein JWP09_66 [Candidatus Taylorbacteria bacterium]|nr:hypothetical protein [Candidatus Taylorbacteria bacterium]
MKNLLLNEHFSWGMVVFFILLAYVIISVVEYVRGAHHRRFGYWFSKLGHDGAKRFINWPVSLKGHVFGIVSFVVGAAIILYINDIRIEASVLILWIIINIMVSHKKSAK